MSYVTTIISPPSAVPRSVTLIFPPIPSIAYTAYKNIILHTIILHCTLLHCIRLYCTVLYSTAQYSTVHSVQYSTVQYTQYSTTIYTCAHVNHNLAELPAPIPRAPPHRSGVCHCLAGGHNAALDVTVAHALKDQTRAGATTTPSHTLAVQCDS